VKRGLPEICDHDRPTVSVVDFGINEWRAATQQNTSSECGKSGKRRAHRPNENKMSYRYQEREWLEVKVI